MAEIYRKAGVIWSGDLREGSGLLSTESQVLYEQPITYSMRFEDAPGTNPEELIAAAHAACYAMALSGALGRKNASAARLLVRATVTALFEAGIKIQSSRLEVTAEGLQGVSAADFPALAREAETGCPVSKVLNAKITMDAKLES